MAEGAPAGQLTLALIGCGRICQQHFNGVRAVASELVRKCSR